MHLPHVSGFGAAAIAALLAVAASAPLTPAHAQSIDAVVTTNLNLRAGPGTDYPVVRVALTGSSVDIFGCLGDLSWCEAWYAGRRGWFSARYLYFYDRGSYLPPVNYAAAWTVPRVSFNIDIYWDSYYRGEPFYAERSHWAPRGIHVGVFYDRLAPYGHWVWFQGQYVWIPSVGAGWSPYVEGRWVYTSTYGWMWVSHEPFGWAAYHYGRWGYSNRIGWFWIPGTRWAPAWVAWRYSDDYLAWAPLPPDTAGSAWMELSYGNLPSYYWQAAPTRAFLSINLSVEIVRDRDRVRSLVAATEPVGGVTVVNNIVVNNVISPQVIEAATHQQVVAYDVTVTSEAAQSGTTEGTAIEIFQPDVAEVPEVTAPVQVLTVEQAVQETDTANLAGNEPTTEALVPPPAQSLEVTPTVTPPVAPLPEGAQGGRDAQDVPAPPAEMCPEGTVTLTDGSCVAPPPPSPQPIEPAPVFEAPTPAPAEVAPPPAPAEVAPPPAETPAGPETEPFVEQAPAPGGPAACPEGMVALEGGQCVPLCLDSTLPLPDGSCPMDAMTESEG